MDIKYAVTNEAFKLVVTDKGFNAALIDSFPTVMSAVTAKNDSVAFQVLLVADESCAIVTDRAPWFSQKLDSHVIRVELCSPFEGKQSHLLMHIDDDGSLRTDALSTYPAREYDPSMPCSLWTELDIPASTEPGKYTASVFLYESVMFGDEHRFGEITVEIEVVDYVLPSVQEHRFHLDLWQHSSNIARKHGVELWSDRHFDILTKYLRSMAELGQKALTLVVSEVPWSGQSCYLCKEVKANLFEYSIIPVIKERDGGFVYDYSSLQRYIDIGFRFGIDREISLYGLANVWREPDYGYDKVAPDYPDAIRIRYYDTTDGTYKYMNRAADIDDYIRSLEAYFITTGQIEKVRLAADEPGDIEAYRASISHLKEIAPAFVFKAAINHAEFIAEFGNEVSDFVPMLSAMAREYDRLAEYKRNMADKRFLWYVCCSPKFPNTYLKSNLLEAYFIGVLTSYAGYDGFLRWNYTVFNDNPNESIIYPVWNAGELNFVYPGNDGGPVLTVRYKALKRGIELYELLERLRDIADQAEMARVYSYVVRERDIRKYFKEANTIEDMCSLDYRDYSKMKEYIIRRLAAGKAQKEREVYNG